LIYFERELRRRVVNGRYPNLFQGACMIHRAHARYMRDSSACGLVP
jgi:hypothetical protein